MTKSQNAKIRSRCGVRTAGRTAASALADEEAAPARAGAGAESTAEADFTAVAGPPPRNSVLAVAAHRSPASDARPSSSHRHTARLTSAPLASTTRRMFSSRASVTVSHRSSEASRASISRMHMLNWKQRCCTTLVKTKILLHMSRCWPTRPMSFRSPWPNCQKIKLF